MATNILKGMAYLVFIFFLLFIIYLVSKSSSNYKPKGRSNSKSGKTTRSKPKTSTKKSKGELKTYYQDIVYTDTTPSTTLKDKSYINTNFIWGSQVEVEFSNGGIVKDTKGRVIGELSNEKQKVDRIKKTLENYPNHYSYVQSYPSYDDLRGMEIDRFRIATFVGWTDKANFRAYNLDNNKHHTIRSSPCREYIEIEISNKKPVLQTQATLLIWSGHLENALEIFLKLWKQKDYWEHSILSICRKLKKYELERSLIIEYIEVRGPSSKYQKRLKVLGKLINM